MFRWFLNRRADTPTAPPPAPAAPQPAPRPAPAFIDDARWTADIRAAAGNDDALLTLARTAPSVPLKLAALAALDGEPALKRASRELRDQDKRVYREAKRRLDALVAQREARERAGKLIESATALLSAATLPANRIADLERRWSGVAADLLEPETREEWDLLLQALNTSMRERGERQQALERWQLDAKSLLAEDAATVEALQALAERLAGRAASAPDDPVTAHLREALSAAAQDCSRRAEQLAEQPAAVEPPPVEVPETTDDGAARRARQAERREAEARLSELLDQTEAALAEGRLADALRLLQSTPRQDAAGPALQARLQAAQAEVARLQGWQHWGGGRAREDLVLEAEALARLLVPVEGAPPLKLAIAPHAAAIDGLRRRWKDLDRQGAANSRALWRQFDDALTAAYVPVAAQVAEQKATRQRNLEDRLRLLDALDAVPLDEQPDLRALLRVLDQFRIDWRSLGPLEHTVPRAERDAVAARERTSVGRLEAPLQAARGVAQAEREALIVQAEAIAAEAAAGNARDTIQRVRDLQAHWQQHAKGLPLARGVEAALWTRFKAATDAVFAERDAEQKARDAQFEAQGAEREALVVRLEALPVDAPADQVRRALADADRQWQRMPPAPRQTAAALDRRFQAAFDAARGRLDAWAADARAREYDALAARVSLCESLEDALAGGTSTDEIEARWLAAPPIADAAHARALSARWAKLHAGSSVAIDLDATLLQLESAFDLPSPPEWQAARRDLKLQAMKAALEGRSGARASPDAAAPLAEALSAWPSQPVQRARLGAVLAALRSRPRRES